MANLVYNTLQPANYLNFENKFVIKVPSGEVKKKERKIINPVYFNVGIYLIIPLLIGIFVGHQLDNRFNTKPIFVTVGIVLGAVSAFYNLWKLINE